MATLTPISLAAVDEAIMVAKSREANRQMKYGQTQNRRRADNRVGYMAEAFVAQVTGLRWRHIALYGADERGEPDVGYFDVRGTTYDYGRLIIHESDPDLRPFVLVIVQEPECRIAGWCFAIDAKQPRYWEELWRYPAYAVPQGHLAKDLPDCQEWMT